MPRYRPYFSCACHLVLCFSESSILFRGPAWLSLELMDLVLEFFVIEPLVFSLLDRFPYRRNAVSSFGGGLDNTGVDHGDLFDQLRLEVGVDLFQLKGAFQLQLGCHCGLASVAVGCADDRIVEALIFCDYLELTVDEQRPRVSP